MRAHRGRKRPSGAQNRKAKAARLVAQQAVVDYEAVVGKPPLKDASEAVAWAARVGVLLIDESLRDPTLTPNERRKTVANLIAKVGLVANKSMFAGRIEAIEQRLAELAQPAVATRQQPVAVEAPPIAVPARGTPLRAVWEASGRMPPAGPNVIEAPIGSRAYNILLSKEPKT
jgi:hypothetical protein